VIDYEAKLKDTQPPVTKGQKKGDFITTDIGEVILEVDQETSRESP
jgi:ribosomal silencing factor RsfS